LVYDGIPGLHPAYIEFLVAAVATWGKSAVGYHASNVLCMLPMSC